MISKNEIKRIRGLHQKKGRSASQQYIIEGEKSVREALEANVVLIGLFTLETAPQDLLQRGALISEKEMKQISALSSISPVLAVVEMSLNRLDFDLISTQKAIALDGIRDPGNLGTIIRTADWFGVKTILLSSDCVDPYNPKTIQATMGSFHHLDVFQGDLMTMIKAVKEKNTDYHVYGALLNGSEANIIKGSNYPGLLIIGSESHGISDTIQDLCTHKLTIAGKGQAESLNASVAAAILLASWFED